MAGSAKVIADEDPFDSLLNLEDQFFNEGYEAGLKDGERAGHLEGRAFGIEKGFEKYIDMGKLHGRATVCASRLTALGHGMKPEEDSAGHHASEPRNPTRHSLKQLSSAKLGSHVKTLYALTEPDSLSKENSEDSIADFDDRLKRANGKVKIIERLMQESSTTAHDKETHLSTSVKGRQRDEGSIEDAGFI